MSEFRSNRLLLLLVLVILTASMIPISLVTKSVSADPDASWLVGWSYRKSHIINGSAGALTDYQVNITLHYGSGADLAWDVYLNSHCRSDFGDIRFTASDGTTLLDCWFEEIITGSQATVWIKVPSIPASPGSASIYVYYGNPTATSVSNGKNTFIDFFGAGEGWTGWTGGAEIPVSSGFTSTSFTLLNDTVYFPIDRVIGTWQQYLHTFQPVHKTNITEVDLDDYKYWAYYCDTYGNNIGLARSNNLTRWEDYDGNPILSDATTIYRWPSVTLDNGIFHMFLCGYGTHFIKRYTSTDGISFTYNETVCEGTGYNPFIWFNPNDNQYYLYYMEGHPTRSLRCRIASTLEGLAGASTTTVIATTNCPSPAILYDSGTNLYWLLAEENIGTYYYITRAYYSSSPTGGFVEASNSPILTSKDACAMPFWHNNKVYLYYNEFVGSTGDQDWDTRLQIQADPGPAPDAGSYRVFDTTSPGSGVALTGQLSTHATNFVCEYKTKTDWWSVADTRAVELLQYMGVSSSSYYGCLLGRDRGDTGASWWYWNGNPGSWTQLSASIANGTWYKVKRIFNFAEDREWVYVDDVYQGYYAWREYGGEVNSISYVYFALGGIEAGTMWLDSFRTRQYASPEITHGSWGSEERATHTLTISSATGGTTDPSAGAYIYDEDETATVTAIPSSNYHFDHWEYDGHTSTANPIELTMSQDYTLAPVFVYSGPSVPEFPMGPAMGILFAPIVIYLLWRSKRRKKILP